MIILQEERYLNRLKEVENFIENITKYEKPLEKAKEEYEDILLDAYEEGFGFALYMLGEDYEAPNIDETLNKEFDGKTTKESFSEYYEEKNTESIKRLVDSEFHRVYNTAMFSCMELSDKEITKTWHTMLDDKVRDTHDYLEGITIPLEAEFITYDGDSAFYPSGFTMAQNNVNCRCILSYEVK